MIASAMPISRAIHLVVFDNFADWEPAYALAELRRSGSRTVRTIGFTGKPVESMGGLRVTPDLALGAVRPADVELLLIPGGDLWESGEYPRRELETLIHELVAIGTVVAAICAGTLVLARAGVLDDRSHTSNMPGYLAAHAPEYRGEARYADSLAVRDRHVITASGLGPVDFARVIFGELEIFNPADEAAWYGMFKTGTLPASAGSA